MVQLTILSSQLKGAIVLLRFGEQVRLGKIEDIDAIWVKFLDNEGGEWVIPITSIIFIRLVKDPKIIEEFKHKVKAYIG